MKNEDDIVGRIKRVREIEEAQQREADRTNAKSRTEQAKRDLGILRRFFNQLILGLFWIWETIIRPFVFWLRGPAVWVFNKYRQAWSYFVYRRNEFGDLIFSRARAGTFILLTLVGSLSFFSVVGLGIDSGLYLATNKTNETIYLFAATDNSFGDEDSFSVSGCEASEVDISAGVLSCDEDDSLYFRVQGDLFSHVWAIANRGRVFYPDYVASTIAPGWNKCVTTSYGWRLKFFIRNLNWYPKLLTSRCSPVSV